MHQRSCRVVHSLSNELCADLEEQIAVDSTDAQADDEITTISTKAEHSECPILKKGINLPKKVSEWSTANEYFKSALFVSGPIKVQDINTSIQVLNDAIISDQNLTSNK